MGFAINSMAALACKAWKQLLEAVHPKLAQGKTLLPLLALNSSLKTKASLHRT